MELRASVKHVLELIEKEEKELLIRGEVTNWIVERVSAEWIYAYIMSRCPKTIVECGTSVGYSTIWLAEASRAYGGRVISIECEPKKIARARQHIELAQCDNVELILGDAEEVLRAWAGAPIDFLFLDANKKGYLSQFLASEPYLLKNSVIIADNVIDLRERVQDFIDYMHTRNDFDTHIEVIGDGLLVAERKVV